MTALDYVRSIIDRYSTPGLKANTLSRRAKRDHLAEVYKLKGEEAEKLLDQLYPKDGQG